MKAIEQIGAALRPPRRSGCTRDTPCCDFWNWGAGELRPACCTQHLLELTDFVHELLSRNEITHWADYGTLLGAIRGQELIPWDDDVDFGVFEADAAAIFALEPEIISAGYALEIPEPTVIRVNYSPINQAHLDLFLWKEQDGMLLAEFDPSYDWPGLRGRTSFPKRYVEQFETVRIQGRSLPAPSPVHDFLVEHRYGDDYMVPARPILRVWLRPEIGPEAMTPRVKEMLAEISEKDYHLADLTSRGRFGRTGLSERWHRAALPFAPAPQAVERYLAAIPLDERSETVAELAHSLAWLDLATEELTPPNPRGRARRTARVALRAKRRIFGQPGGPNSAGDDD